jgi:hypothetical protein
MTYRLIKAQTNIPKESFLAFIGYKKSKVVIHTLLPPSLEPNYSEFKEIEKLVNHPCLKEGACSEKAEAISSSNRESASETGD